jgi:hypothetical protein
MATVHRAHDTRPDKTVAVKLLRREVIEDTDIAMRFRREALAATVLRHPNIVACLETGTDDGQPFLVMDLIEGEDLAARLRRAGRLAPAEATRIGLDVARALGVAHIRGIVHRDVKPGNILLARDGRAMVTDFGIARLSADAEGSVPGTTLGSVHYFSPEQAQGETTTAASDVYSLGLVLYEMLTGQRAWRGGSTTELATVRIGAAAPSPKAIRPEVPTALDRVVVRALDPDPARRYANGNALAVALEPIVAQPDPSSPTVATNTASLVAGAAAVPAAAAAGGAMAAGGPPRAQPPVPATVPPMRPTPPPARAGIAAVRRASPAIAGPLFVLMTVIAVVGGALLVAAISGRGEADGVAAISPTPRATRTPTPTPRTTPRPTPTPTPVPTARPIAPKPTPKPPGGTSANLCDPFLGIACGLDQGFYEPSKFAPAIRFELGRGWSDSVYETDLIALVRDEGDLTFASGIATVFPHGDPVAAPNSVRALTEAFIETDGVAARTAKDQRIGKRRASVVDLAPTGQNRVPLFATSTQTFYLEPVGTTRVFIVDDPGGPFVVAVEPGGTATINDILRIAQPVIRSLTFR